VRDNCPCCVDGQPCGEAGVSAFGDPENRWMRARRVWTTPGLDNAGGVSGGSRSVVD
jgi:hypothetical protein